VFSETEGRTRHESPLSQLPSLFKRFCDQLLRLLDAQLALFKAELKAGVKIYAKHLILTMSSTLIDLVGFTFLSLGLVFWVNGHTANLAISFGCVGGTYLILGFISALVAVRRMAHQRLVFNQTLEELEKDQQWITSRETHQAR
jgi:uncharacterized membrane protein YqjE